MSSFFRFQVKSHKINFFPVASSFTFTYVLNADDNVVFVDVATSFTFDDDNNNGNNNNSSSSNDKDDLACSGFVQ